MIFYKLLLCTLSALSAVHGQQAKNVDLENKLFFDFATKSSNGWAGIEGWRWTPNNKGRLMALKGLPDSGGDHDVLVLANPATNTATLTSPLLSAHTGQSCLYFNYYIRTPNNKQHGLTISTVSASGYKRQLWGVSREDFDIWETAAVQIDRSMETRIEFHGEKSKDGMIAINGFFLEDGECRDSHPIDCNFEGQGLCQWTTNDPINQVKSGEQHLFSLKPEDHTSDSLFGHTAMFVAGKNQAVMFSPIIRPSQHKCLTFSMMSNSKGISLNVHAKSTNKGFQHIWSPARELSRNEWHSIQIPLFNLGPSNIEQFMINFTNYDTANTNAIQIDDIKFRSFCQDVISGTYSYSMGEWRSSKYDTHRWQLGTGRLVAATPTDNVYKTPIGMYTDFSGITQRSAAVLHSYWVDYFNFDKCAEIEFQVRNFQPSDKFVLNLVEENGNRQKLWSFTEDGFKAGVIHVTDNIYVHGRFISYRLELIHETDHPLSSVTVIQFKFGNKPSEQCQPRRIRPTPPSGQEVTTIAPVVQKRTKLNPSVRALVSSLLKNLKTEVNNILHVIGDKSDVAYELVSDVDADVEKAIAGLAN